MSQRISSSATDHLGRGYPRPQLRRDGWVSLNGLLGFCVRPVRNVALAVPRSVGQGRSRPLRPRGARPAASGVTSFFRACWYRRAIAVPRLGEGERLLLHFGAVDYEATVWVDGLPVGQHDGGYTPFTVDITPCCSRRRGPSRSSSAPRTTRTTWPSRAASRTGSSSRTRSGIRAPPASGRRSGWRRVPATWIGTDPLDARTSSAGRSASRRVLGGDAATACACDVTLRVRRRSCSPTTRYAVVGGEVHRRIALSDPGIDDYRNELLWSPESPTLIEAELELCDERRRAARRGAQLHRAALDRRAGRPLRAQRPALPAADGARPGLLAGDAA